MKAQELRIGNYYDNNGRFNKVTPSVIQDVMESERTWCKPIPLTEEILLKCGFNETEKLPGTQKRYEKKKIKISISNSGNFYTNKIQVIYLHQLQNLYYALTNEELTIKL